MGLSTPLQRQWPTAPAQRRQRTGGALHTAHRILLRVAGVSHSLGSCDTLRTGHSACFRDCQLCNSQTINSGIAASARTRKQLAGAQVRVQGPDDAEGDAHAQQQRAPQVVLAARVAVQQLLPLLQVLVLGASPDWHILHTRRATSHRHRSVNFMSGNKTLIYTSNNVLRPSLCRGRLSNAPTRAP